MGEVEYLISSKVAHYMQCSGGMAEEKLNKSRKTFIIMIFELAKLFLSSNLVASRSYNRGSIICVLISSSLSQLRNFTYSR